MPTETSASTVMGSGNEFADFPWHKLSSDDRIARVPAILANPFPNSMQAPYQSPV